VESAFVETRLLVLDKSPAASVIACPWEVILPSALVTRLVRSLTDCALAFCASAVGRVQAVLQAGQRPTRGQILAVLLNGVLQALQRRCISLFAMRPLSCPNRSSVS
jgi:hypothetical protein